MNSEVLKKVRDLVLEMEAQSIVHEEMIKIMNSMNVPGTMAQQHAQQKAIIEAQLNLNVLTIANLKDRIKSEENK